MFDRANTPTGSGGWRPMAGFTWEVFCLALMWTLAFGMIPLVVLRTARGAHLNGLLWTAFWAYFALTYKLTALISNRYRDRQRNTVMSAQDLLSRDARPYVLYLRPFKEDEITSRLLNLSTEEQELATVMLDFGPFIAFGEPGEEFPDPGAARMYVEEEGWRSKVEDLMAGARLVVARAGTTDSFWWEMARAVDLVKPENLLLLLPRDQRVYEDFRQKARDVLPCQLPDHEFRPSSKTPITLEGFLHFESDWTPRLVRFEKRTLRQPYWAPGVSVFKSALRPVYDRFSVEWKRPPLQLAQLLAVILLLLSGMFTLYVMAGLVAQLLALFR